MVRLDIKGIIVRNDDGWIYDWFGYENTTPNDVNTAIAKANGETLDVYINSDGGDIFSGSEIYEALRTYAGDCKIHVVGLAASAASVIACARASDIAPTAMVMVHNVSGRADGDYHKMDKNSEVLQKANQTIAAAYMAKTGMTQAEALDMMDKETWLTAQDAVERGLIDSISKPVVQLTAHSSNGMIPPEVLDTLRNKLKRPPSESEETDKSIYQARLDLLKIGGIV